MKQNIKIAKELIKLAMELSQQKQKKAFKTKLSEVQIINTIEEAVKKNPPSQMQFYLGKDGIMKAKPYEYKITIEFQPGLYVDFVKTVDNKGIVKYFAKAYGESFNLFKKLFSKTQYSYVKKHMAQDLKKSTVNFVKKYNDDCKNPDEKVKIFQDGSIKWNEKAFNKCKQSLINIGKNTYFNLSVGWIDILMSELTNKKLY